MKLHLYMFIPVSQYDVFSNSSGSFNDKPNRPAKSPVDVEFTGFQLRSLSNGR